MENKNIIIVGGTGDIGKAIVNQLLYENFNIIILAKNISKSRQSLNKKLVQLACDISDIEDVKKKLSLIMHQKSELYGLINCAGINKLRQFEEYSPEEINEIINVNLIGVINVLQILLPIFKKQRFGKIVSIASQAGIVPQKYNIIYSIAKSGIISLTKGLAKECAEYNISINSICPGDIESNMMDNALKDISQIKKISINEVKHEIINLIPLKRYGQCFEVAELAKELIMLKTQYLTGSNIVIAGGRTCY